MKPNDWPPLGWTTDEGSVAFHAESIGETLSNLQSQISSWSESSSIDAQVLLAHITGQSRGWLLSHPEIALTPGQQQALNEALTRLNSGEPLPYVLGHWEFYGLDFTISADTLIPRPETELLVEQALNWLKAHPGRHRMADVGTGSGCIAVSLAALAPNLHVTASDISPAALEIARANAQKHGVANQIEFIEADLLSFHPLRPSLHLICANLPYIPTKILPQLKIFGKEPTLALDGGLDGLELIRRLLPQATRTLAPEGLLLLEIEASLGDAAISLVSEYFPKKQMKLLSDLAGNDRLIRLENFID